jgi:translation elongation factor P/translation initiation factor 5A
MVLHLILLQNLVSSLVDKYYTYLYSDKKKVYLSNPDTYEEIEIDADKVEGTVISCNKRVFNVLFSY